jgi:hypothetical protein
MTKTIEDINIDTWFVDREVQPAPEHFVSVSAPLSEESKEWILEKLRGRFSTSISLGGLFDDSPSFEDPKEAVFYELTWG